LFVLLLFSNLVINYTTSSRTAKRLFLLSLPLPSQIVFRWKLMNGAAGIWAFSS